MIEKRSGREGGEGRGKEETREEQKNGFAEVIKIIRL